MRGMPGHLVKPRSSGLVACPRWMSVRSGWKGPSWWKAWYVPRSTRRPFVSLSLPTGGARWTSG